MTLESELQTYLQGHIPITESMGIQVVRASPDGVVLQAPLEPNVNHRSTVFGGSAVSVAILSCWSLIWVRLQKTSPGGRIVIHRSEMDYERPLGGPFTAESVAPPARLWDRFLETLERRGKARIHLDAIVHDQAGQQAGLFHGRYVTFGPAAD